MKICENSPAPRPVQKEEQELLQEPKLGFPAQGEAAESLQPMGPREVQKSPGDPTVEQGKCMRSAAPEKRSSRDK